MSDEGLETFEVSETPEPEPEAPARAERRAPAVAEKRYLHITIVDHNAVIEQTGEVELAEHAINAIGVFADILQDEDVALGLDLIGRADGRLHQ